MFPSHPSPVPWLPFHFILIVSLLRCCLHYFPNYFRTLYYIICPIEFCTLSTPWNLPGGYCCSKLDWLLSWPFHSYHPTNSQYCFLRLDCFLNLISFPFLTYFLILMDHICRDHPLEGCEESILSESSFSACTWMASGLGMEF